MVPRNSVMGEFNSMAVSLLQHYCTYGNAVRIYICTRYSNGALDSEKATVIALLRYLGFDAFYDGGSTFPQK